MQHVLILDIGKSNAKVLVLNETLDAVLERRRPNQALSAGPYPHYDVEGIWNWFLLVASEVAKNFEISAISVTTHGATAALIDRDREGDGLVLPVLDYESSLPESCSRDYGLVRSGFAETRSPNLSAGLNLGRQLFWLQRQYGEQFRTATDILLYPQYWVWRLTGELCSEVTSLGCHTDLWAPELGDFSALVDTMGWRGRFPALRPADSIAGKVKASVSRLTGLPATCRVSVGIHDSNASYLRYAKASKGAPFSVVSTGTWAITMVSELKGESLDESRDMLMNVDYRGKPVACARFMAGREYEKICHRMGSFTAEAFGIQDLEAIVHAEAYALPQFSEGSGPFSMSEGRIVADVNRINGAAIASMYCALMLDFELDLLRAEGDIFLEGAFLKNRLLLDVLAALRPEQALYMSLDTTGTAKGAAYLAGFQGGAELAIEKCAAISLNGLREYRNSWRKVVDKDTALKSG